MKTIAAQIDIILFTVAKVKRRLELTIILLTNTKPFATLERIIIGMAN